MHTYGDDFYQENYSWSFPSAQQIVPLIIEIINPKSVIDVGCGVGTWLSVFCHHGIDDILGVDGTWVDHEKLRIPRDRFLTFDLTKSFRVARKFDLVVSLEVAEHLPEHCAKTFVESLVSLGSIILFSAAIPLQAGTNHINEQWPDYWAIIFNDQGFEVVDCIRKKVWNNDKVEYFYAQNLFLYVDKKLLVKDSFFRKEHDLTNTSMLSIVHPKKYLFLQDYKNLIFKKVLIHLPFLIKRTFMRRINKLLKL